MLRYNVYRKSLPMSALSNKCSIWGRYHWQIQRFMLELISSTMNVKLQAL